MLHIVNGGSTEQTLRQTSLSGEFFSFRDALINGPAPAGTDGAKWRRLRAQHLGDTYGAEVQKCEEELSEQDQVLASVQKHDEVVLWFEHDLFCQLNLLYLLDWFSRVELTRTRLSLINIGEFPGRDNFRGLGELNATELTSLFAQRCLVGDAELSLGARAWEAYCSPDPRAIEGLLNTDTSALPFLETAFTAHLERFPSISNGLGRIENRCLELVDSGQQSFSDIFLKFLLTESVYGLGDAQVWTSMAQLRDGRTPLLAADKNPDHLPPELIHKTRFTITQAGKDVLRKRVDYLANNEIDVWLGGAHLQSGKATWRWNETTRRLQLG